jgi:hypothetical protein
LHSLSSLNPLYKSVPWELHFLGQNGEGEERDKYKMRMKKYRDGVSGCEDLPFGV